MRRAFHILAVGFAVFTSLGCKGKRSLDVGPVNALVPAKYEYKLRFESRVVINESDDQTYVMPVPKTWKTDDRGTSKASDRRGFGSPEWDASRDSSLSVHSEPCFLPLCDFVVGRYFRPWGVVSDARSEHGRIVEAIWGPTLLTDAIHVSVVWWQAGTPRVHTCEAVLDDEKLPEAVEAFLKACELVDVQDD